MDPLLHSIVLCTQFNNSLANKLNTPGDIGYKCKIPTCPESKPLLSLVYIHSLHGMHKLGMSKLI